MPESPRSAADRPDPDQPVPPTGTVGQPLRLTCLISGSGSTLANLIERIRLETLPDVRIVQVISSRPGVRGVELARAAGIPVEVVARRDHPSPAAFSAALTAAIDRAMPDLVVMAGFLSHWALPHHYEGRVLNIHPALLPSFGGRGMFGLHVHAAVLASGAQESGCTVHLVDQEYDHGPILAQRRVAVRPDDTPESLAARVQAAERDLYPAVLARIAREGLTALRAGRRFD